MPINPRDGEDKNEFISRCIETEIEKYGKEQKQAAAICYSVWERKNEDLLIRMERIIGDETVTGDITTNTAKGRINTGCPKGYIWDKEKEVCVKSTNEKIDWLFYEGYAEDFIKELRFYRDDITKPNQIKKKHADEYAKRLGLKKDIFWKAVNNIKNKAFKLSKDAFLESTLIGGSYVSSVSNVAGSGQTRIVGARDGEIEVLTRVPKPLKWSDLLGIYVPDLSEAYITEGANGISTIIKTQSEAQFKKKFDYLVAQDKAYHGHDPYSGSWSVVPGVKIIPIPAEFQDKKITKNMIVKIRNYLLDIAEKWEPALAIKTSKGYIVAAWASS